MFSCPQSLNYTRLGYAKQKLPEDLFEEIRAFWKAHHMTETVEAWNAGNTFTNHWAAPSALVSLEVRFGNFPILNNQNLSYFSLQLLRRRTRDSQRGGRSRTRSLNWAGPRFIQPQIIKTPVPKIEALSRTRCPMIHFFCWLDFSCI